MKPVVRESLSKRLISALFCMQVASLSNSDSGKPNEQKFFRIIGTAKIELDPLFHDL